MQVHPVSGHDGAPLELDLCHACHGIWFDGNENLRMAAASVVALFRELHAHRSDAQQPLSRELGCPRCRRALVEGTDLVKHGRYFTYRCPQRHGRFSTFSSFMIEKGFVRQLTQPEIADLAERVRVIHCGCSSYKDHKDASECRKRCCSSSYRANGSS